MRRISKYTVTVNGWFKLLALIALLIFTFSVVLPADNISILAMFSYMLLFTGLSIVGSNNRFAEWLSEKNIFICVFFIPSLLSAIFFAIARFALNETSVTFAFLLSILSLPFAFAILNIQTGIRRWNAFAPFIIFPIALYILVQLFQDSFIKISFWIAGITVLVFFIIACIEDSKDHAADSASRNDRSKSIYCTARWEGSPDSVVRKNVIHLRGTIIVEYSGDLNEIAADAAIEDLIKKYVTHAAGVMPDYSVDDAEVTVKYRKR